MFSRATREQKEQAVLFIATQWRPQFPTAALNLECFFKCLSVRNIPMTLDEIAGLTYYGLKLIKTMHGIPEKDRKNIAKAFRKRGQTAAIYNKRSRTRANIML